MNNHHLAILKKPYLDAILDGRKTIESRFTRTRRVPFGQISVGDKVFLKQSSGPICAEATVTAIEQFDNLTPEQITQIKKKYNHLIKGSNEYWHSKENCRFGVLVWLKDVKPIEPIQINKKDWRAWVLLTEKENFGLFNTKMLK